MANRVGATFVGMHETGVSVGGRGDEDAGDRSHGGGARSSRVGRLWDRNQLADGYSHGDGDRDGELGRTERSTDIAHLSTRRNERL